MADGLDDFLQGIRTKEKEEGEEGEEAEEAEEKEKEEDMLMVNGQIWRMSAR